MQVTIEIIGRCPEDDATSDAIDRFEVIEYWGILDTELAEEADIDLPPEFEDRDEVRKRTCCNGRILRLCQSIYANENTIFSNTL